MQADEIKNLKLNITARIDCVQLAAFKYIIEDFNKKSKSQLQVNYNLLFEADFNIFRQDLLKKHIEPSLIVSPIIYLEVSNYY
jgi:hypothetical protein